MTQYLYYPGCSLEGTAREYDGSTRTLMEALGVEMKEIDQWTCCGASAAETSSLLLALSLSARNIALAEAQTPDAHIVVPCSACYLNLKRVEKKIQDDKKILNRLNEILGEEGLRLNQTSTVRHLLDVLARDIGPARFEQFVKTPLKGLKIAPYYGCQCLRPYTEFDDPEKPKTMDDIIRAAGAAVWPWRMGAACCGASLMTTKPAVGEIHVKDILAAARGADAVLTVCPMCQMNLEAHQRRISRLHGDDLSIPVLYLPQFMGLAMNIPAENLYLSMNLSRAESVVHKMHA